MAEHPSKRDSIDGRRAAGLRAALTALALALASAASAAEPPLIIIDAGHGGRDWGASVRGRREKDITLAVAQKLRARLQEESGLPVLMTRKTDEYLALDQRVEETLDWEDAVFVSLHVNDVRSRKVSGMTVYSFGKSGHGWRARRRRHKLTALPAPPRDEIRASYAFGRSIARSLRAEGFRVDPGGKAEYYVLKNPEHPSVLIEMGYLSNPSEAARLSDPSYQEKIAEAIAHGLERYLAEAAHRPASATVAAR